MDSNEYLYHYTNIETLALILSNRTIRFNSLDKMDDLQEQQTADMKNIGQLLLIWPPCFLMQRYQLLQDRL